MHGYKMNREFVSKFIEAKKMEREAFMALIPPEMQKHIEVIEKEVKAMALECITGMMNAGSNMRKEDENSEKSSTVNKINIG